MSRLRDLTILLFTALPAVALSAALSAACALAATETDVDGADAFAQDVQPFLEAHCVVCHGPDEQAGPGPL